MVIVKKRFFVLFRLNSNMLNISPCNGHLFLLKLVAVLIGKTYFRGISMIFRPFSLFF